MLVKLMKRYNNNTHVKIVKSNRVSFFINTLIVFKVSAFKSNLNPCQFMYIQGLFLNSI